MKDGIADTGAVLEAALVPVEAVECVLSELLVALLASGALTRWEVAKALLRAEVQAQTQDGDPPTATAKLAAQYVRTIEERLTPRLALKPELHTLRHERAKWLRRSGSKPDPIETNPPIDEPEPPSGNSPAPRRA